MGKVLRKGNRNPTEAGGRKDRSGWFIVNDTFPLIVDGVHYRNGSERRPTRHVQLDAFLRGVDETAAFASDEFHAEGSGRSAVRSGDRGQTACASPGIKHAHIRPGETHVKCVFKEVGNAVVERGGIGKGVVAGEGAVGGDGGSEQGRWRRAGSSELNDKRAFITIVIRDGE